MRNDTAPSPVKTPTKVPTKQPSRKSPYVPGPGQNPNPKAIIKF